MQIAVNIPDEFAAQVESRGLKLESYVEQLVAERAAFPRGYGAGGRLTREEFRACLDSMTEDADEIPSLPDEALSRESIYSDHD